MLNYDQTRTQIRSGESDGRICGLEKWSGSRRRRPARSFFPVDWSLIVVGGTMRVQLRK